MSSALAEILLDDETDYSVEDLIATWKTTEITGKEPARSRKLPANPAGGIVIGSIGRAAPAYKSDNDEVRAYSASCYSTDCYSTTCYSTNCYSTDCYSTSCYSQSCATVYPDCG